MNYPRVAFCIKKQRLSHTAVYSVIFTGKDGTSLRDVFSATSWFYTKESNDAARWQNLKASGAVSRSFRHRHRGRRLCSRQHGSPHSFKHWRSETKLIFTRCRDHMLPTTRLLVYLGNIAMEDVFVFVRMSCLHSIM